MADRLYIVLTALSREKALRLWDLFMEDYREPVPDPVSWTQLVVPEGRAVKTVELYRRQLRTVNTLERINKNDKKTSPCCCLFSQHHFVFTLVTAVAMEIPGEWETDRT